MVCLFNVDYSEQATSNKQLYNYSYTNLMIGEIYYEYLDGTQ